MATYVTSDAHGHVRALDRALEMAQPGAGDVLYVLGDMVDRGPDPVGVLKLVRSLPGARVLMGNHERMLLDVLAGDGADAFAWELNGGYTTASGLDALDRAAFTELVDWVAGLPLFDVVDVEDLRPSAEPGGHRVHLLCHAGIDALAMRGYLAMTMADGTFERQETSRAVPASASVPARPRRVSTYADVPLALWREAMARQSDEDLLWTRGAFWGAPTGLVGADGRGPVVVAGHTPSIVLARYAVDMAGTGADAQGRGVVVEVGATQDTGGVPDRIDIDCSAAVGHEGGRVGIMRLEDRRVWLADIERGE